MMAQLFGSAILSLCVSMQGSYHDACSHAIDAGTRQIGLRQDADKLENGLMDYSKKQSEYYLGKDTMSVVGFAGFGYKVAKEQKVQFKLPNLGMCTSVNNEVTRDSYTIKFLWNF